MLFEPKDIGLKYRILDNKYFEGKLVINKWPRDFFYADGMNSGNYPIGMYNGFQKNYINSFMPVTENMVDESLSDTGYYENWTTLLDQHGTNTNPYYNYNQDWYYHLSKSMILMNIEIIDESTYNPDDLSSIKVKHVIPLSYMFLLEHMTVTMYQENFDVPQESAEIVGINIPPDALFRLVWVSDINSDSFTSQTGFAGYTSNKWTGGYMGGDDNNSIANWPDVVLGTNFTPVYRRSEITRWNDGMDEIPDTSLYKTDGSVRLKATERDYMGMYQHDGLLEDEFQPPVFGDSFNYTMKNFQFPGVTVGSNPNDENSTPDNNGFTWHQIDATYNALKENGVFTPGAHPNDSDFVVKGIDSIYCEHYCYPVTNSIYYEGETPEGFNQWSSIYQNGTNSGTYVSRSSDKVWMKPSRCVETIRVWLTGAEINDNVAFTIDNIPQFAGKVFRWKHLKDNNNYGIRVGTMPIVSRDFRNLIPPAIRRGNWNGTYIDMDEWEGHTSMTPIYSPDMGVEDFSSLGASYGQQNSLDGWTGANPENYQQFYDAIDNIEDFSLISDVDAWIEAHQNGGMENPLIWMTQHNNNNYIPGGAIFNSVTGLWEMVETNPNTFAEYGNMMTNGLSEDQDWLDGLSSHHLMGLHKMIPLNRANVGYSYKRTERRAPAGLWTYVDIDVYTKFLNNGPQRAVVNCGIWDEETNDFDTDFIDYRAKYHHWFFVANNHPEIQWQKIKESIGRWADIELYFEFLQDEVTENWGGDWQAYIDSGGYVPFANNPEIYDVVANGGYGNISQVIELLGDDYSNAVDGISAKTTDLSMIFNVEAPQGILARNGMYNFKTPIKFTENDEALSDVDTWHTFNINYDIIVTLMSIGDVWPSVEFCRLHTPRKHLSFYDTTIESHKWPVKITDIVGNSSMAVWDSPSLQLDANIRFTDGVIDSIVKDDGGVNLKKNCIRYYWCDDSENFLCEESFPELNPAMDDLEGNLVNYNTDRPSVIVKAGMSFNKFCNDSIENSCCEPLYPYFDKGTANYPMPIIQNTGISDEIVCGLTTQEVDYFYQQFNQYIGYSAGGTTYYGGTDLYFNTGYGDTMDAWGEHVEYGNELYGRILFEANVLDPDQCDCGGSPCLQLVWYNQSPCSWVSPYNTDDIRNPQSTCVDCRPDSELYLDENRKFNTEMEITGVFPFGPAESDEDWITITEENKNDNWDGQYECTHCPNIDSQYFPIDDIYQAPCGKTHGVNGAASMNIVFSDLSNNDFNLSQGNFWVSQLIFPHQICIVEVKDENGDILNTYGGCADAADYPYASSPLGTFDINDNMDGQGHSMTVRTCGNENYHCQSIPMSVCFSDGNNTSYSNLIIDWNSQGSYEGCTDPLAENYNANAVWGCEDCCQYKETSSGGNYYENLEVEGSNKVLSFTADLDRWDQYVLDEGRIFGALPGAKGELILSAYDSDNKTLSSLKQFQGSEEKESSFTWASKNLNFGYDDVYKNIKKIKVMVDHDAGEEGLLNDDTQLFGFLDGEWTGFTSKTDGPRTKVFIPDRARRKCKSLKLVLSASKTIESISIIYTMKSIK
tara:strand:- start:14658 stop:19337 length:4680 start_codon:yes stop_codon:yes gene_type:complete